MEPTGFLELTNFVDFPEFVNFAVLATLTENKKTKLTEKFRLLEKRIKDDSCPLANPHS